MIDNQRCRIEHDVLRVYPMSRLVTKVLSGRPPGLSGVARGPPNAVNLPVLIRLATNPRYCALTLILDASDGAPAIK